MVTRCIIALPFCVMFTVLTFFIIHIIIEHVHIKGVGTGGRGEEWRGLSVFQIPNIWVIVEIDIVIYTI